MNATPPSLEGKLIPKSHYLARLCSHQRSASSAQQLHNDMGIINWIPTAAAPVNNEKPDLPVRDDLAVLVLLVVLLRLVGVLDDVVGLN